NSQPLENVWLIYSGASKHMIGNKNLFHTLSDRPTVDQITIIDNQEYIAAGIGDVIIPLGRLRCTLTKVLYVPGLTSNLLSMSQLLNHRMQAKLFFEKWVKSCIISHGDSVIAQAFPKGHLFTMDAVNSSRIALSASTAESTALWQFRYSQLSTGALHQLSAKDMVRGIPPVSHSLPVFSGRLA
ncbi:hypothetical protein KI387_041899, partial [Taxus chinensis]